MSAVLREKLKEMLDEKRLSAIQVEKMAGLKGYGVRNILLGRSQKPNVYTLKAIADVLGCPMEELLDASAQSQKQEIPTQTIAAPETVKNASPSIAIDNPQLFIESTMLIMRLAQEMGKTITLVQVARLIKEVYVFALKKNLETPDTDFAEWLLEGQLGDQ